MVERIVSLEKLTEAFAKLPGVGKKSAARMALGVLGKSEEEVEAFASALLEAKRAVHPCPVCGSLTEKETCAVCDDLTRDRATVCVVEDPRTVMAIEKAHTFSGLYHVLGGVISPMNGVTPEKLNLDSLVERVREGEISEVIVATNPTPDGEVTAMYLSRLLKPLGVTVTRLAYGVPMGGELEYTDEVTLGRAIEGRRDV